MESKIRDEILAAAKLGMFAVKPHEARVAVGVTVPAIKVENVAALLGTMVLAARQSEDYRALTEAVSRLQAGTMLDEKNKRYQVFY